MTITIGQQVAGFEVTGRLGAGGMGEVFRARDTRLQRDVALKVVAADVVSHPSRLERLRREARLLAALSHPAIAAIHGLEDVDGVPILVLELIEGPTLQERLRSGPPLPLGDTLRLAAQIAGALTAAHAKGIIHRDLKPANIKLTPDGHVKILDFGIAKALAGAEDGDVADEPTVDITAEGAVFGTAPYMSPEQVRGAAVDRATDVWAFGCVLFEMLSGRRAFANVAAVLEREPDWSKLPAATPREVRDLLRRCMHKDAARRPGALQDAAAMLDELGVAIASGRAPARFGDARRWIYAGVAAAAGIAIVVAVMGIPRSDVQTATAEAQPAPLQAGRRTVAVLTLRNLSGADDTRWIGTALGETLSADLRAGDRVRVIPGERVVIMQRDLDLLDAEAYTVNTLNRIRGVLGCDYVVTGAYLVSGDRVRTDLRVQDARTGELIGTVSETGDLADLITLTSKIGAQVRPALGLGIDDEGRAGAGMALPTDPRAARLYAAAVARMRDFDLAGARPLLEQAIAIDARAPLVHHALAQIWSAHGYHVRAAASAKTAFELSSALPWRERLEIEARHAEFSRDFAKAIGLYQQLLQKTPDDLETGLRLAAAQRNGGRPKDSLATVAQLRRLPAPASDDPRLDLEEAAVWLNIGDGTASLAAAQRAVDKADGTDSRYLLGRAYNSLAAGHLMKAEYDAGRAAAREAQRMAEAVGDKSTVAWAMRLVGSALGYLSDHDGMARASEQAAAISRELGEKQFEANGIGNMAIAEVLMGRLDSALKHEQEALALRLEIEDRGVTSSYHNLAEIYQSLARLDDAERDYQREIEVAEAGGERVPVSSAHSGLGDVMGARDRAAEARRHFDQAIEMRRSLGLKGFVAASQLAKATFLLQQGAAAEAEPLLVSAVETFREVKDRDREAWATGFLARAQLAQGRAAEARKTIEGAMAIGERAAYFRARFTFLMNRAAVIAASGAPADLEAARKSLDGLIAEATANGMVNRQFEARLELGRIELMTPATASAGRARLQALQNDSRARGYLAIARLAGAALTS